MAESAQIAEYMKIRRYVLSLALKAKEKSVQIPTTVELSRKFGVSRQYLHRIFSRFYGCSVNRALCRHRLMVACRLLQEAPLRSISEICYAVGFNDLSYFYRKFREEFGCVPGEMRRNAMPAATEEGR